MIPSWCKAKYFEFLKIKVCHPPTSAVGYVSGANWNSHRRVSRGQRCCRWRPSHCGGRMWWTHVHFLLFPQSRNVFTCLLLSDGRRHEQLATAPTSYTPYPLPSKTHWSTAAPRGQRSCQWSCSCFRKMKKKMTWGGKKSGNLPNLTQNRIVCVCVQLELIRHLLESSWLKNKLGPCVLCL